MTTVVFTFRSESRTASASFNLGSLKFGVEATLHQSSGSLLDRSTRPEDFATDSCIDFEQISLGEQFWWPLPFGSSR